MANPSSRHLASLAVILVILCGSRAIALASTAGDPALYAAPAATPPAISVPIDTAPASAGPMLLAARGVASSAASTADCPEATSGPFCQGDEEGTAPQQKSDQAQLGTRGTAAGGTTASSQWPWRRASVLEYLAIAGAASGTIYFERKNDRGGKAHWTGRNSFDEGIRDALRLGNRDARDVAHMTSNILMAGLIAAPVVETFAVQGVKDSHWDAMWQTQVINLESFTFTSLVSSVLQNTIARERPFVRNCAGGVCEGVQENRGMPSGHTAFAFTGAGLLCTHHKYQNYYNSETADSAVCATGLSFAAATGLLRIVADRHYATDVLAGTALGLFSGFILPRILHYPWSSKSLEEKKAEAADDSVIKQLSFLPEIYSDGGGLKCAVTF